MKTQCAMLVAVLLVGCAQAPVQVDVSDSVYHGVEPANSLEHQIAELVIVNKAGPGKKHHTLLSDSIFPMETAPPTKDIVQEDVRHYFNKHLSIDPTAERTVRITISDADAYWVMTSIDKIPFVGIFTVMNDTEFGLNLKVLIEIEEDGKVVSSYLYDETITTEGKAITRKAMSNSYQNLISIYREQFFGDLDSDFINRYF